MAVALRAMTTALTHGTGQGPLASDIVAGAATLRRPDPCAAYDHAVDTMNLCLTVAMKELRDHPEGGAGAGAAGGGAFDDLAPMVQTILAGALTHSVLTGGGSAADVPAGVDLSSVRRTVEALAADRLLGGATSPDDMLGSPAHPVGGGAGATRGRSTPPAARTLAAAFELDQDELDLVRPPPRDVADRSLWHAVANPTRRPAPAGELRTCLQLSGVVPHLAAALHVDSAPTAALVAASTGACLTAAPDSVLEPFLAASVIPDPRGALRSVVSAAVAGTALGEARAAPGFVPPIESQLAAAASAWCATDAPASVFCACSVFREAMAAVNEERHRALQALMADYRGYAWEAVTEVMESLWASDTEAAVYAGVQAAALAAHSWRQAEVPVGDAAFVTVLASTAVSLAPEGGAAAASLRRFLREALGRPPRSILPRGTGSSVREAVFRRADLLAARATSERAGARPKRASARKSDSGAATAAGERTPGATSAAKSPSPLAVKFNAVMGVSVTRFAAGLAAKAGTGARPPRVLRALHEDNMGAVLTGGITAAMLAEAISAGAEFADDPPGSAESAWAALRAKLGLGFQKA